VRGSLGPHSSSPLTAAAPLRQRSALTPRRVMCRGASAAYLVASIRCKDVGEPRRVAPQLRPEGRARGRRSVGNSLSFCPARGGKPPRLLPSRRRENEVRSAELLMKPWLRRERADACTRFRTRYMCGTCRSAYLAAWLTWRGQCLVRIVRPSLARSNAVRHAAHGGPWGGPTRGSRQRDAGSVLIASRGDRGSSQAAHRHSR
jgi:hypothetical protein